MADRQRGPRPRQRAGEGGVRMGRRPDARNGQGDSRDVRQESRGCDQAVLWTRARSVGTSGAVHLSGSGSDERFGLRERVGIPLRSESTTAVSSRLTCARWGRRFRRSMARVRTSPSREDGRVLPSSRPKAVRARRAAAAPPSRIGSSRRAPVRTHRRRPRRRDPCAHDAERCRECCRCPPGGDCGSRHQS